MLTNRIIPCLDVFDGQVVKGIQFKNHVRVGSIVELAEKYNDQGADELVFYDIKASTNDSTVSLKWVKEIAKNLSIPFCVAGGIKTVDDAKKILNAGADKVSINTPAIQNPYLIKDLSNEFGRQCVVVGIDSFKKDNNFIVYAKTGSESTKYNTNLNTKDWVIKAQELGAGEIVLNCMNQDGARNGFDIDQIQYLDEFINAIIRGIKTSVQDFQDIGLLDSKGVPQQISTGILQIENELYDIVRPKRSGPSGSRPATLLKEQGIEYLELRGIDINPFIPEGIDENKIKLLDVYIMHSLISKSPEVSDKEIEEMRANQKIMVGNGRSKDIKLRRDGEDIQLLELKAVLHDELKQVASAMDEYCSGYSNAVDAEMSVDCLPSERIMN